MGKCRAGYLLGLSGLGWSLALTLPAAAQAPAPTSPATPAQPAAQPEPKPAAPAGDAKASPPAQPAEGPDVLPEVVVTERSNNLVGKADSATQGTVGPEQLRERPLLRPGELLETVPGVIITQHSGSGKANQYFLRGFNLDHGTDLATWVAGMPVNLRTHGHGQGYTDLNFLIPELVSRIDYRKGSYRAEQGDFSSAGSIYLSYFDRLPNGTGEAGGGNFGFGRLFAADSHPLSGGDLLYGMELFHYDGPWDTPEDFRKANAVLRFTRGTDRLRYGLTGMAYHGTWNSTDQIPERAVERGRIGRFGTLDPTDGGESHRYSLSAEVGRKGKRDETTANAYLIDYKLNLFSNFTYFLDDPDRGDQFQQADRRQVYGVNLAHKWDARFGERTAENVLGFQFRYDDIGRVALYNTQRRNRFNTIRRDAVQEASYSPYFENRVRWTPWFRSVAGLRFDPYSFDVQSSIAANSGSKKDSLLSPKLSLIFGPWQESEFYFNVGQGFHSNDARGTTIRVDPKTGDSVDPVTPLVRSNFAEVGLRTAKVKNLQSTLSLWYLKFDSELLFVGDAGTTEASRPSRRTGIEFTNYYTPSKWLTIDADYAFSRARFTDFDRAGDRIPGAIEGVASLGVSVDHPSGWFGSLRLRYFGPRPLIEDNSVRSSSTTLVNARLGYRVNARTQLALEVFNLLNAKVNDIEYYYTSRLPGEPAEGVNDVHFHPAESRSFRLTLQRQF